MKWTMTGDDRCDVSSYYEALRGAREVMVPWKSSIWCTNGPKRVLRVAFFVWTAFWGKILTGDNLINRGISLVVVRLLIFFFFFLHCDIAYEMWTSTFLVFGAQMVMLKGVVELLYGWRD